LPEQRSFSPDERSGRTPTTDVDELTGALRQPEAYPHETGVVGFRQTQMSLLFFAGDFVYKIKKPVNLGYVDYTSFEARHHFCKREVELNRRLCPEAYLGVVAVTRCRGRVRVEEGGNIVEHAVKMRRLPEELMLDYLLTGGMATVPMMHTIASRVASFHTHAASSPDIAAFGSVPAIRYNTEENFQQTLAGINQIVTRTNHSLLREYANNFLDTHATLVAGRAREGKIRDCHGDLHAAHVCMTDEVCIYDCIEFNDRFRYGDVASEVAFLAMDLDRFRRHDLSQEFVDSYADISRDSRIVELMRFYKCYRSVVRGKVEGFKLSDRKIPEEEKRKALWLARTYFHLAISYATGQGLLIIMSGLTGSGKSAIAEELGSLLAGTVISSDVVRKELAGLPADQHSYESFGQGIYSTEWTQQTYGEMLRQAQQVLSTGHCAILDASFLSSTERIRALATAKQQHARALLIECTAPYDLLRERVIQRRTGATVSDARPEILEGQIETRDPVTEFASADHIRVDTTRNVEAILEDLWPQL